MNFHSLEELAKWIDGNGYSGATNEDEITKILETEAKRLQKYLYDEYAAYYRSYTPKVYERTYKTMKAIQYKPKVYRGIKGEFYIELVSNQNAYHPSLFKGEDGNTLHLLSYGWRWRKQPEPPIERFSKYNGSGMIRKAIQRFNDNNPHSIKIEYHYGNKRYE